MDVHARLSRSQSGVVASIVDVSLTEKERFSQSRQGVGPPGRRHGLKPVPTRSRVGQALARVARNSFRVFRRRRDALFPMSLIDERSALRADTRVGEPALHGFGSGRPLRVWSGLSSPLRGRSPRPPKARGRIERGKEKHDANEDAANTTVDNTVASIPRRL